MTGSTSSTPTQSEAYPVPVPVSTETAIPYCPAGLRTDDMKSPSGTQQTQSSGWRVLAVVRWLQMKLSQILSQLHLLSITRGRSLRWRRLCRQFIQAGVALLMVAAIMPLPAFASTPPTAGSRPRPPQDQLGVENASNMPDIANPLSSVDVGGYSTPSFADIDGDGDLDAFIGERYGTILYFQNIGDATNPTFSEASGSLNPLNGVDIGSFSTPTFADIDGDGDLDAFIGEVDGTILYFQNIGDATNPAFTQITGTLNPFNGKDVGTFSNPSFADLDADGDLDAFIGEDDGYINYFENTGGATSPAFVQRSGTLNPFNGVNIGAASAPSFADLDEDGDLGAFIGDNDGIINYFDNTGSATSPSFIQRSGSLNPFNSVDVGNYSTPSFADLDADGDLDTFIGSEDGTIQYNENIENSTRKSTFEQRSGSLNPFNGVDVGIYSAPSFADLDGDGDLDAFIGDYDGVIKYYQNTGSATSPAFIQRSGTLNPFNGVDVGLFSTPSFADLDGDGDLDAFIGE